MLACPAGCSQRSCPLCWLSSAVTKAPRVQEHACTLTPLTLPPGSEVALFLALAPCLLLMLAPIKCSLSAHVPKQFAASSQAVHTARCLPS